MKNRGCVTSVCNKLLLELNGLFAIRLPKGGGVGFGALFVLESLGLLAYASNEPTAFWILSTDGTIFWTAYPHPDLRSRLDNIKITNKKRT